MSKRKIKDMEERRARQKITKGLTNKERQKWGEQGRKLTGKGKPIVEGK